MNKKEILKKLDNILDYHNKNLTKKQFYALDEIREALRARETKESKAKSIFLVCQTHPSEGLHESPIYTLTSEAQAINYARKLNKSYAKGVILSPEGDFEAFEDNDIIDDLHYYTTSEMLLNEPLQ